MAITPKTKAKKIRCNGILFDSSLEAEAYTMLIHAFGQNSVIPHPTLNLAPPGSEWYLPDVLHKPDFLIFHPQGEIYLEIKGRLRGGWHGKSEYAKNLALIHGIDHINYTLWVGNGDLAFEGKDVMNFAWPMPRNQVEVMERIFPRYRKGDF